MNCTISSAVFAKNIYLEALCEESCLYSLGKVHWVLLVHPKTL